MEPSHNTEYGDMARGGVLIRKNERAYRGSERRESNFMSSVPWLFARARKQSMATTR